jgi:hypothetical protein
MSKPKRRGRVSATQGLVEGIMQAVATFNAEMGLEGPRMPQDETRGAGPTERPARPHESKGTDQAET